MTPHSRNRYTRRNILQFIQSYRIVNYIYSDNILYSGMRYKRLTCTKMYCILCINDYILTTFLYTREGWTRLVSEIFMKNCRYHYSDSVYSYVSVIKFSKVSAKNINFLKKCLLNSNCKNYISKIHCLDDKMKSSLDSIVTQLINK